MIALNVDDYLRRMGIEDITPEIRSRAIACVSDHLCGKTINYAAELLGDFVERGLLVEMDAQACLDLVVPGREEASDGVIFGPPIMPSVACAGTVHAFPAPTNSGARCFCGARERYE